MSVFDTSSFVSAAFRLGRLPDLALRHAFRTDDLAVSEPVLAELIDVMHRPGLACFIDPDQRSEFLDLLHRLGTMFTPATPVTDCRDDKDNMVLELAFAAEARLIVASDKDLLVLHPWRTVQIVSPATYLAQACPP